jgi:hypothetical protein
MKSAIKLISLGTIVTGGLATGFNLGMLIGYIKNTDLSESRVPPFPV